MRIRELKNEAQAKLSGKWTLAVEINFLHLIITLVLSYVANTVQGAVASIIALILGIITIPLSYGLSASMLKLSRDEVVGVTDFITIGFKNFKRAFFLSLSIFVRVLVPIILMIFAGVLTIVGAFAESASGIISLVALLLVVGSIIWMMYKILSYALCTYLLIDDENAKSKDVIKRSTELMKGNKARFVGLVLSFFGWLLLAGFVSGFAQAFNEILGTIATYGLSLLLTPYITFAEIAFYEDLASVKEVQADVVEKTTVEEPSVEE
jgi:uncharacterized membrane protein